MMTERFDIVTHLSGKMFKRRKREPFIHEQTCQIISGKSPDRPQPRLAWNNAELQRLDWSMPLQTVGSHRESLYSNDTVPGKCATQALASQAGIPIIVVLILREARSSGPCGCLPGTVTDR